MLHRVVNKLKDKRINRKKKEMQNQDDNKCKIKAPRLISNNISIDNSDKEVN